MNGMLLTLVGSSTSASSSCPQPPCKKKRKVKEMVAGSSSTLSIIEGEDGAGRKMIALPSVAPVTKKRKISAKMQLKTSTKVPKVKVPKVAKVKKPRKPRSMSAAKAARKTASSKRGVSAAAAAKKKRKLEAMLNNSNTQITTATTTIDVSCLSDQAQVAAKMVHDHIESLAPPLPAWPELSAAAALARLIGNDRSESRLYIKALKKQYDQCTTQRKSLLNSLSTMCGRQYIHEVRMIHSELVALYALCNKIIANLDTAIASSFNPPVQKQPMQILPKSKKEQDNAKNKKNNTNNNIHHVKNAIEQDRCTNCGRIYTHSQGCRGTCPYKRCGESLTYQANTNSTLAYGEEMEFNQSTQEFRKSYRKALKPFMEETPKPPKECLDYVVEHLTSYNHAHSSHMFIRGRVFKILKKSEKWKEFANFDLWIAKTLKGEYVPNIPQPLAEQLINMYHLSHLLWPQVSDNTQELTFQNFVQKPPFTNFALNFLGYPELAKGFHRAKGKTHMREKLKYLQWIFTHYRNACNPNFMPKKEMQAISNDTNKDGMIINVSVKDAPQIILLSKPASGL